MTAGEDETPVRATAPKRLFIFSLWYFPSHFGLHVVDIAASFACAGYDVTIVTVAETTFALPYFDAFREVFGAVSDAWPQLVRLNVDCLEERGAYNPRLVLRSDSTFHDLRLQIDAAPCHLLHFFEMFLPYFNAETVPSSLTTSVLYAGNFITRVIGQNDKKAIAPPSPERVAKALLAPYSIDSEDGGYRLRGVDCIFSETHELVRMLRATMLRTPCWWTDRPVFVAPVLEAPPYDIHATWRIPPDTKVLLYAGRPAKNARALLPILGRLRSQHANVPIVLLLVGVSADGFAAWPGARAMSEAVRTAAFVSRPTLYGIMKAADVFVYPGLVDGYPKVLSEANLARLPVVAFASPASGVHEMAVDGSTALLVETATATATSGPENERFAAAVVRILTEPALREALVEHAFVAATATDAPCFVSRLERAWRSLRRYGRAPQDGAIPDGT